jgi:hypothetical protein
LIVAFVRFSISAYSARLSTSIIRIVGRLPVVGGTCVAVCVGSKVAVAVGPGVDVDVTVPVGAGVPVGNGEGIKDVDVGNGVNVGKGKLNRGVGLASIPAVGNGLGPGVTGDGLRDRAESRPTESEHKQQTIRKASPGRRILPSCPCWL